MSEQTILVTGATDGLGRNLVRELAGAGAAVIAHGRSRSKLDDVVAEVAAAGAPNPVRTVVADLADLRQVAGLAAEVLGSTERIDVLVSNAGIGFGAPGAGRELSADGYELRFAVNYLAGYHLTRRLLPLLATSAPARIVQVASLGQYPIDFDDLMSETAYDGVTAYRRSKLAQVMFTFDLAAELASTGVTVNALHPATFMDTTMVRQAQGEPMSTVAEGAESALRLIASSELDGVTGRFFNRLVDARAHDQAYDAVARRRLHDLSEELVGRALA